MNFVGLILNAAAAAGQDGQTGQAGSSSIIMMVIFWAILIAGLYFLMIKPQKKQAKQQEDMQNSLEPGDSIMTTSGFYGTVLDVEEDTVIVEFGNNKNCRIPMHRKAIAEVEKAGTAVAGKEKEEDSSDSDKKKKDKKEKKEKDA